MTSSVYSLSRAISGTYLFWRNMSLKHFIVRHTQSTKVYIILFIMFLYTYTIFAFINSNSKAIVCRSDKYYCHLRLGIEFLQITLSMTPCLFSVSFLSAIRINEWKSGRFTHHGKMIHVAYHMAFYSFS